MPQKPKQQLSMASLGPQGGGSQGPNAAVQAVQQQADIHAKHSQMAIQKIMQMQQEAQNQLAIQGQQLQSGVADVANQVAGGLQKLQEDRKREREKVEGVQLQEDMMEFQQKLQQDAALEAQRIGMLQKQAQEATANEIANWREKTTDMKMNLSAMKTEFNTMVASGMFRKIPNGYKRMDEIWKSLQNSQAYVDDHADPAYISHAVNLMHEAERDILAGRDPMDLAALYDKPKTSGLQNIGETGTPLANPDGRTRFNDQIHGGYPAEGIYSIPEDDERLKSIKLVTPGAMSRLLIDNATYTSLVSDESRQKFIQSRMKQLDDEARLFTPMAENYKKVSDMMFQRSNEAIRRGVDRFSLDPNPQKFQLTSQNVVNHIIEEMFPEAPGMAQFAQGVRDRTIELDTAQEFASVMTLEAAASAIHENILGVLHPKLAEGKDEKNTKLSAMTEQWASQVAPQEKVRLLGRDALNKNGTLTEVGLVRAQSHVQGLLEQAASYAGELRDAANAQGAVQGYVEQHGDTARLRDVYLWMHNAQSAQDQERAQKLLFGQLEGQADQMTLTELEGWQPVETDKARYSRSILDSTLEFIKAVNPDQLPRAAALLSGGQVDLTDGRIPALNAAAQSAAERSSYMKLVQEQLKDRRETSKQMQQARAQGVPINAQMALANTRHRQQRRTALADKLRAIDAGQVGLSDIFSAGAEDLLQRTQRGYAKIGAGIGSAADYLGENFSKGMMLLGGDEE